MSKSRTIAYLTWAIGNVLKMTKDITSKGVDWVADRIRYNVEITLQGVIMDSKRGLTSPQIIALLDTMSNFGNIEIHVTNCGEYNETSNNGSEGPEEGTEGRKTDQTIHTDRENVTI